MSFISMVLSPLPGAIAFRKIELARLPLKRGGKL
jgi:hypothetical protein